MAVEQERYIQEKLGAHELQLSERLGQHFLTDPHIIGLLEDSVQPGATVIEVGSGIGHVTEALAKRAGNVIGIEIDRRFQPLLEEVQARNPNIRFILKDALYVPFQDLIKKGEDAQVVANIPFHITEPFLYKLIDLPISDAILIVGDNIARELMEPEDSLGFGKMALLGQTFFDICEVERIPRDAFLPPPRTEASLLMLDPKDSDELKKDSPSYIFGSLFRKSQKFAPVKNDIKQAIVELEEKRGEQTLSKSEQHRRNRANVKRELKRLAGSYGNDSYSEEDSKSHNKHDFLVLSQSQALEVIRRMGIPESIQDKPFFRLSNTEIRQLTTAVRNYYR